MRSWGALVANFGRMRFRQRGNPENSRYPLGREALRALGADEERQSTLQTRVGSEMFAEVPVINPFGSKSYVGGLGAQRLQRQKSHPRSSFAQQTWREAERDDADSCFEEVFPTRTAKGGSWQLLTRLGLLWQESETRKSQTG